MSPSRQGRVLRAALGEGALKMWVHSAAFALVIALPLGMNPWERDYHRLRVLILYPLTSAIILGWWVSYLVSRRPLWRIVSPETLLWAYVLAVLLSSWTSVDFRQTVFGAPARHEGLLAILSYAALFLAGVHFFGTQGGARRLAKVASGAAFVVIGYGLVQAFSGVGRPASTMGNPFVLAGYLTLISPIALGLGITLPDRSRHAFLVIGSLGLAVVTMTLTRAAWLAASVGLTIFLIGLGRDGIRHNRVALTIALVIVVIVDGLWLATVATPAAVIERGTSSFDPVGSFAQRTYIWRQTMGLIRERPVLGWGIDTLGKVFPYDRPTLVRYFGPRPVIIDKTHNDILQVAVSTGIPGAAASVGFWTAVVVAALRNLRREVGQAQVQAAAWLAGIAGYLIQIQFSFSVVGLAPLAWLFAGAVAGWDASIRQQRDDGNDGRREGGPSPLQR